jgi:hypothetical protein
MNKIILVLIIYFVSGCTSTGEVVKMGPDTYSLWSHAAPIRGGITGAKTTAIKKANKYCASIGKEIIISNVSGNPFSNMTDITFQCLDKDDPKFKRPIYKASPHIVIENR